MSVNSLSNFGVPGLNGDRGPVLQPIFPNRFRVSFFNFGNNGEIAPYDLTRQVKAMGRPNVAFQEQALYSYVSTIYVVNRGEWQAITIRFYDEVMGQVASRVEQQISKQQNFFDQTASRAGENYKFEMDLDLLAGGARAGGTASDPNVLRKYCFAGCMITADNLGDLDYTNANATMEIGITVRFDNCVQFGSNGIRLGTFSHGPEIAGRRGVLSTGAGAVGGINVSITGSSVNVGVGGLNIGG